MALPGYLVAISAGTRWRRRANCGAFRITTENCAERRRKHLPANATHAHRTRFAALRALALAHHCAALAPYWRAAFRAAVTPARYHGMVCRAMKTKRRT